MSLFGFQIAYKIDTSLKEVFVLILVLLFVYDSCVLGLSSFGEIIKTHNIETGMEF